MRMWRNGRRACLRGKWETVGVRPSPSAPRKTSTKMKSFFIDKFSNYKLYINSMQKEFQRQLSFEIIHHILTTTTKKRHNAAFYNVIVLLEAFSCSATFSQVFRTSSPILYCLKTPLFCFSDKSLKVTGFSDLNFGCLVK